MELADERDRKSTATTSNVRAAQLKKKNQENPSSSKNRNVHANYSFQDGTFGEKTLVISQTKIGSNLLQNCSLFYRTSTGSLVCYTISTDARRVGNESKSSYGRTKNNWYNS